MNRKRKSYFFGLLAEYYTIIILFFKGYKLLVHRFKTKYGEIDLVFKKGNTLIAVEVKARSDKKLTPEEVVTRKQFYRIINTLKIFLNKYEKYYNFDLRIDVVLVNKNFLLRHRKSIWKG